MSIGRKHTGELSSEERQGYANGDNETTFLAFEMTKHVTGHDDAPRKCEDRRDLVADEVVGNMSIGSIMLINKESKLER